MTVLLLILHCMIIYVMIQYKNELLIAKYIINYTYILFIFHI